MAVMASTASSFMYASSYIGMTSTDKLGSRYASSWGLQAKAPTKLNVTKVGAMSWSMPISTLLKPKMILTEKKCPDLDLGCLVKDERIYEEKFCIRSYEIGPNRTATVETLMHLLQETSLNYLKSFDILDEDFGTADMSDKNLTWVMVKMQMIVDRYPTWGDTVQINTWKGAYGNNGVCSNFAFYDCKTGETLVRVSSIWVMMNKKTRKLSRFPDKFRDILEKHFVDTLPIIPKDTTTWSSGDETTEEHICNGLIPRMSDLDHNQHVNYAKYIGFILESVPKAILENYEIDSMTLQYYQECAAECVLQSVTSVLANPNGEIAHNGFVDCQHLLKLEIGGGGRDIVKGRTRWWPKNKKSRRSSIS